MKNKTRQFLLALIFLLCISICYAQHPFPENWKRFVSDDSKNTLMVDTFLHQSFEDSFKDTWSYSSTLKEIKDVSSYNIKGQTGEKSLILYSSSTITFHPFNNYYHQNIRIGFRLGGTNLKTNTRIKMKSNRSSATNLDMLLNEVKNENFHLNYNDTIFLNSEKQRNPIHIGGNPFDLELTVTGEEENGFYCIDNISAFGEIGKYSLFTGSGKWNDTIQWSHLPVKTNRHAMVEGDILIDCDIICEDLLVHNSSIDISAKNQMNIQNLYIYDSDISLINNGEMVIDNEVVLYKDFKEKGEWYFISFPFDIYPEDIDPDFSLGDKTNELNGNYLYVLTYDGAGRSQKDIPTGNWKVVNKNDISILPLFEKGKGYLVAIDKASTKNRLSFTGRRIEDFGKDKTISINIADYIGDNQSENYGWYLCGNPLPSPISINGVHHNNSSMKYIYVYEGNEYKSYALEKGVLIAPFSAFFIQVPFSTHLNIQPDNRNSGKKVISTNSFSYLSNSEPEKESIDTKNKKNPENKPEWIIKNKTIHFENITAKGKMICYNLSGKVIYTYKIPKGNSSHTIPLASGFYIIQIHSNNYQTYNKLIIP